MELHWAVGTADWMKGVATQAQESLRVSGSHRGVYSTAASQQAVLMRLFGSLVFSRRQRSHYEAGRVW